MNKKFGRLYIYIITFIITALLCFLITRHKINKLEFVPLPDEFILDLERVDINFGDSMESRLSTTRLSSDDKITIKKELASLGFKIGKIKAGEFFEILYSTSGQWTNFRYYPEGEFFYSLKKEKDDAVRSSKEKLGKTSIRHNASGTIESSLWDSMSAQGVPPAVILSFADIFAWKMDFLTDTRAGDTFRVIYDIETLSKKNKTLSSKIVAARYTSGKKTYTAIFFTTSDKTSGYFDENGASVKSAFLKAPLQFRRISSHFSLGRKHPILKYVRPHLGIDYAAPTGTPVSSIANGTVTQARYNGGFGHYVEVKHSNGYVTSYGHLSKYGRGIKKGVKVSQGQIVGYVGSTGLSTGPHLDFRIKKDGRFFNFLTMKQPPTTSLKGKDKENFNIYKEEFLNELDKPVNPAANKKDKSSVQEQETSYDENF